MRGGGPGSGNDGLKVFGMILSEGLLLSLLGYIFALLIVMMMY